MSYKWSKGDFCFFKTNIYWINIRDFKGSIGFWIFGRDLYLASRRGFCGLPEDCWSYTRFVYFFVCLLSSIRVCGLCHRITRESSMFNVYCNNTSTILRPQKYGAPGSWCKSSTEKISESSWSPLGCNGKIHSRKVCCLLLFLEKFW